MSLTTLPFFQHVKWKPDGRELRRFAFAMLIGFFLLGLLAAWRTKEVGMSSIVLWGIGTLLASAAFVPKLGRVAYLVVYLPTSIIGYVMSYVILGLMFFVVIAPLGILLRWLGKDLLQERPRKASGWTNVKAIKTEDSYYRQF